MLWDPDHSWAGHGADLADLTGDGIEDGVVGAYAASEEGAVYVHFGPLSGTESVLDADVSIKGTERYDYFGRWLDGSPDLDGDGIGELFVVASWGSLGGIAGGAIYGFFGPPSSGTADDADILVVGSFDRGYLGELRTLTEGELDGDGHPDLVVGDWTKDAGHVFLAIGAGHYDTNAADIQFSDNVTAAAGPSTGDLDGDGVDELFLGSAAGDDGGYLYGDLSPGNYTPADAFATFSGPVASEAGIASAFADFDADGRLDLAIGAPSTGLGKVYIFDGE